MCIVKANLARRSRAFAFETTYQWTENYQTLLWLQLPPSPPLSLCIHTKKKRLETSTGDAAQFICTWSTVCLNTGGMKNKEQFSLLPSLFSLSSSPSGMFCMNTLPLSFFQAFSCYFLALYTVSLTVIYTITNRWSPSETQLADGGSYSWISGSFPYHP